MINCYFNKFFKFDFLFSELFKLSLDHISYTILNNIEAPSPSFYLIKLFQTFVDSQIE